MGFEAFEAYAVAMGMPADVVAEDQGSDCESGLAQIDGETWHVRTARTTPTKPGAFVAFWRRDANGDTAPFGADDVASGLLVLVEQDGRRGVFRFSAGHLANLGITAGKHAGKRGFRVYPSWCTGLNLQATRTQRARAPAFQEY
ncbi:MepB family protein [Microbacterium sp. 2216-1]|uniref:MepB family protein n=1 Tax=Microbacterium sp. 2216-1 TaxID=3390053 RepID=UPI003975CEFA